MARRRRALALAILVTCSSVALQSLSWVCGHVPSGPTTRSTQPSSVVAARAGQSEEVLASKNTTASEAVKAPRVAPTAPAKEDVDLWTYIFGKPGEFERDLGLLNVTPTQFFSIGLFSIFIGLAANLWGQTEFFLRVFPPAGEVAKDLKLDAVYAVEDLKGYYEQQYRLRFPSTWLFDQRIALAKFGQLENTMTSRPRGPSKMPAVLPDAAWGPAGSGQKPAKERENLSVVKQALGRSAGIEEILGDPKASLEKLLRETIAPEGSKRTAQFLKAELVVKPGFSTDGTNSDNTYYEYEWRTTFTSGFSLRTYSSAALGPADSAGERTLYTLTMVLPEAEAMSNEGAATLVPQILRSFQVASK